MFETLEKHEMLPIDSLPLVKEMVCVLTNLMKMLHWLSSHRVGLFGLSEVWQLIVLIDLIFLLD